MRALSLAVLMLPSIALADVSTPTDSTPTDTDAPAECAAEGDACTTDDGEDGNCDADLVCVHDLGDDGGGCNTSSAPIAGGVTLLSLGLLGLRRRSRR